MEKIYIPAPKRSKTIRNHFIVYWKRKFIKIIKAEKSGKNRGNIKKGSESRKWNGKPYFCFRRASLEHFHVLISGCYFILAIWIWWKGPKISREMLQEFWRNEARMKILGKTVVLCFIGQIFLFWYCSFLALVVFSSYVISVNSESVA